MKKPKTKKEEENLEENLSEETFSSDTSNNSTDVEIEEESEGDLDSRESEVEELRGKYLRLAAEFDNYRKRMAKEKMNLIQTAEKDVLLSLLEVLDDAERAEDQMQKTDNIEVVHEGALLIFNKLKKVLDSRGLKEMDCLHQEFDAELQEAIAEVPAPQEELIGKVVDVVQKGYYLNDKIIRHAKVVVGK